jgi:glycosyltransferase involved in cell wall biosynthesis
LNDKKIISTISKYKDSKVKNIIRLKIDQYSTIFYKNRKSRIFSTGFVGFNFTKLKEYNEADIIHLHWINGGFVNIKLLSKIKKPIIWTMRDMWPMTGGCHYSLNCEKYKTGCGKCEQLRSKNKYDLSKIIFNRKKRYISKENINLVGISRWLSEEASKSKLFKNFDIRTISNNINEKEFYQIDKNIAKEILNLKTNKKIILTGAKNLNDFYKGFHKFLNAIEKLNEKEYYICFFGKIDSKFIENIGFDYTNFGILNDSISLRLLYSASDVFVATSLQEAFGKTIAEAMSCGTPVVCFNANGPKDIVDHKENGYLATPYSSSDLVEGIKWVLEDENRRLKLSSNAREKVLNNYTLNKVASQYIKLYKDILNKKL